MKLRLIITEREAIKIVGIMLLIVGYVKQFPFIFFSGVLLKVIELFWVKEK